MAYQRGNGYRTRPQPPPQEPEPEPRAEPIHVLRLANVQANIWRNVDDNGKRQMIVHYFLDGRQKSIPFSKLKTVIEATLREGDPPTQPQSTLPLGYEPANGR